LACTELFFFLAEAVREKLVNYINQSSFIGSAVDESTDVATEQGLIQYVSYVKNCRSKLKFFNMLPLQGQDAASVFEVAEH
jgi:hypothetical protein